MPIKGLLFDKDGTLFDFQDSWAGWARHFLGALSDQDPAQARKLGAAIGYDWDQGAFLRDSVVIAGTNGDIVSALLPLLPGMTANELSDRISSAAEIAPMSPAVPLRPLFEALRSRGLALGVATNDAEAPARVHLRDAGVLDLFDFVAGADSGFGGKPAPGMCLAFAEKTGLMPGQIAMVGDSLHDLEAGRAAGMTRIGVLTGLATRAELQPHADVVFPDIGHLPEWLDAEQAEKGQLAAEI